MYLTLKNQLRNLPVEYFETLRLLCHLSKNLYNEAFYSVRQYYFTEHKRLKYESNYHECKGNENYKALGTDVAQQTMKVIDRNFKSFYALIEKAKEGNYQFKQIRMPHYLPKAGYFSLIIPRISIKNGSFAIPMSRAFKKEHGEVRFEIPPNIEGKEICEVRIHPRNKGRFFEIEYIYDQSEIKVELNADKYMAIDFGLDNLATCVTNGGASMILDGKRLKSYNRLYNKINANIQSSKDKSGVKGFNRRQVFNIRKRNRRVNHAMSVAASMSPSRFERQ